MTLAATWVVRCDRIVSPGGVSCGATLQLHLATPAQARRAAAAEGWTRAGTTDACPHHSRSFT